MNSRYIYIYNCVSFTNHHTRPDGPHGRFEKIAVVVPQLDVEGKYRRILARFHQELEKVSRIYCRQCESPPQLRGLPPVAGEGKMSSVKGSCSISLTMNT